MNKLVEFFSGGSCRLVSGIALMLLTALLPVSCTLLGGDVYEAQADLYEEYRARIDTASSYTSMKELNDELERELVVYIKENGEALVEAGKKQPAEGESVLAKAEADYTKAYLNKYLSSIIKEQLALFSQYSSKVTAAASYEELSALDGSLGSAVAGINTKSNAELKVAKAKNLLPEQFAALAEAQAEYNALFVARMAPYAYEKEKSIYEKYQSRLAGAKGYEQIKEVGQYLKSEIAIFNNDNSKVFQSVAQGDYLPEKAAVAAAKENFERSYMSVASFAVLEYQKQIYNGAVEVFSAVTSADELDRANRSFIDVNNSFQKENTEELQWIVNAARSNNVYKKEIDEVNACLDKVYEASKKKAAELSLL